MRIVLFGDVHLYKVGLAPWHLLSKRILGQTNLWLNRRTHFDRTLVGDLTDRIDGLSPDFVLSPGDLTTTATHAEFRMARGALADTVARYPTFITPGNHDRYTFTAARHRRFEHYFGEQTATRWPHLATIGEGIEMIALDSVRPNCLFDRGRIGDSQRQSLAELLRGVPADRRIVILCHYTIGTPPGAKPESPRHALVDEAALVDTLAAAGRPLLFIHGHVHRPWCWRHDRAPNVVAINAGSPTHIDQEHPRGQGLWTLDTTEGTPPWQIAHHRPSGDGGWTTRDIAWPTEPGEVSPM